MVLGIETLSVIRFLVQLSAVVAGSAALWCFVFACKSALEKNPEKRQAWKRLAFTLSPMFFAGSGVFIVGWWLSAFFLYPYFAAAHEGVVHSASASAEYITAGFNAGLPWVSIFSVLVIVGGWLWARRKTFLAKHAVPFFGTAFALLSIVLSLSLFKGSFDMEQAALSLHNWHSFLTLGTVLTVDFLYLFTVRHDDLKRVLYPFFPWLSASIWFGLGLDFVSSFMVLGDTFPQTAQFFFNQIVVVVLVINGAVLSVRINNMLIGLIEKNRINRLSPAAERMVRISGSISIVSWLTITFLDFVSLTASLGVLLVLYAAAIAGAYIVQPVTERSLLKIVTARL